MSEWGYDKRWSDKFMPEIKRYLGQVLISEAPPEEDAEHNTDLIVLTLKPWRIACRIRRSNYACYRNELTIRASRPSGAKTELAKILEGWGDYLFYGFSNSEETNLCQWFIGDLKAFRIWYCREVFSMKGGVPGKPLQNRDGSSSFYAYLKYEIPGFVVAEQTAA
jgi:hypothetical protein